MNLGSGVPSLMAADKTCTQLQPFLTKGVCKMEISPETNMTAIFSKLGIECVRKKDTSDSLTMRKILNVDPFNQGVIM